MSNNYYETFATMVDCDYCGKTLRGNEKKYKAYQDKNKLHIWTLCSDCNNEKVFNELKEKTKQTIVETKEAVEETNKRIRETKRIIERER